ncbi:UbiH/UbiF/VisC/COQ6 family ubiquinone biosynthesis hydroxylase [Marinobacterium sediminicola]|uniref:2-octaprenyl-3-methyl-6-methoxy-1,4-benzoquinol hydroxylase n=1 Tax=Marinobacterium sediminicola TaxID=518898 RepID=A0ABY1S2M2_9GAMM|nr:UbiH/UbiF/VisC/COQ6 family ubiquinone biosynthesis hydroxylase [Marinobacterium sediminicola]ULG70716.1 UbiH/UbiF/VisC/COQ6 family ubiquinone biosynthesis hydroxylase [Marinobacterium sediminicola]SMR77305.1 2-octaprenyl-3-methyl-6-methoxy-1,4-benzoquinol hydroxylase [Marinobacterium sediminicola]
MKTRYDILIVGGGMVGSALACALGESGLSVGVLERSLPESFSPEQPHDLRVSALSIASERFMQNIGAWQGIQSRRSCPYKRMKVWENNSSVGATEFDAADSGYSHLGHIVENRIVQIALLERVRQLSNVDLISPAPTRRIDYSPGATLVELENGDQVVGRLVVAADGGDSMVRQAAGIGVTKWDYHQHALVAGVTTAYGQEDITWQQFTPTGPLAFLPLSGHNASLVWYNTPNEVKRLRALPDDVFLEQLHACFPSELGQITEIQGRSSFPLRRQHAQQYALEGLVLVGDAAHMIHPLAGQGVNIGLLDAAALAEVLLEAHAQGEPIESLRTLKRYEDQRRRHNLLMMQVMDSFYHVFSNDLTPLKLLRNVGLGLAGRVTPARKRVMEFAMGIRGSVPDLAR